MSGIVIDTSIWIEYFRGGEFPIVDDALKHGAVVLPAVVAAELLSGTRRTVEAAELRDFLETLRPHGLDMEHWYRVGALRATLAKKGVAVSTPDTHMAQCAIDVGAPLLSRDRIFARLTRITPLQIIEA